MIGVNEEIRGGGVAAAESGTDWAGKLGDWAMDAMYKVTAGAVYKHTNLNTMPANQNNTPVITDAYGNVIPAGTNAALAGLKQTGKTVQDVLQMNTTTMAIMAVGVAFFAWVLLKK